MANITGQVTDTIVYRLLDTNHAGKTQEDGTLTYNLTLSSGTGNAQIDTAYARNTTFSSAQTLDLFNLNGGISFMGSSGRGNVKLFKLENLSTGNIVISLPFVDFSGNQTVPPSGNVTLSNSYGFVIPSSNSSVNLTGPGYSQNYIISILGSQEVQRVSSYHSMSIEGGLKVGPSLAVPRESKNTLAKDNVFNFDHHLNVAVSTHSIPIEYAAGIANSSVFNTESTLRITSDYLSANVEYGDAAIDVGPSGISGEQLIYNPYFIYTGPAISDPKSRTAPGGRVLYGVGSDNYSGWTLSYNNDTVQARLPPYGYYGPDDPTTVTPTIDDYFKIYTGAGREYPHQLEDVRFMVLDNDVYNSRKECTLSQTIYSLVPSQNYVITFIYRNTSNMAYRQVMGGYPTFKWTLGSGTPTSVIGIPHNDDYRIGWPSLINQNITERIYFTNDAGNTELTLQWNLQAPPYDNTMWDSDWDIEIDNYQASLYVGDPYVFKL